MAKVTSAHAGLHNASIEDDALMGSPNEKHSFSDEVTVFTCCCRRGNEAVQVICSEDCNFDVVGQRLIVKQNEDLWRAAKPGAHRCILPDQTLQSKGKSSG